MAIIPVILCGGSGTRLWPLSRQNMPKQFAPILGDESLFQMAATRLMGPGFAAPVVVTGADYRFIVQEQLAAVGISEATILVEPSAKNTAPAVLAAALAALQADPDAVLVIMPADHAIPDAPGFAARVEVAVAAARAGKIVTFGVIPDRAETGYGWLELTEGADLRAGAALPLKAFVEKPPQERAEAMLAAGHYLWNAGIFVMSAAVARDAFQAHVPAMVTGVEAALAEAEPDLGFVRLAEAPWDKLDSISVDYAIMERVTGLMCVPFGSEWSDLGDWNAIWRALPQSSGTVRHGATSNIGCEGSVLWSDGRTHLVGVGLKDIVAVAVDDAVLVADRNQAQRVKDAVGEMKAAGVKQGEVSPRDHRPWGWFESLAIGPRFQVKRIVVKPGGRLSLQSHEHRAEHWIVVGGTAKVTIGDEVKLVRENELVFVPLGAKHRMENPGTEDMVLIEVQTGSYLGEDDIVRYDDVYARGQGAKG